MTSEGDRSVSELFNGIRHNWAAPAFAERVLFAPVVADREATQRCASVLSAFESHRADRFVTDEGRTHFIQRRAFRRYCGAIASGSRRPLSQIEFEESENGRPWLRDRPDLWFSFSSCRLGFVGAWSSTHGLGVDLEARSTVVEASELAQMYFTDSEAQAVETAGPARLHKFLQLWCLKEAALKSLGEGLPYGIDAFEFELNGSLRLVNAPKDQGGPENFSAHLFAHSDVYGALVARQLSGAV